MFSLAKQPCKIAHLNLREQKEGDEDVLCCDIKLHADVPNGLLDQFAPGMRAAFYDKPQDQMELGDDHRTVLRFPFLYPLDLSTEMPDATFIIHGANKSENMEFVADVNKVTAGPKEGGTVALVFRAQIKPEPAEVGDLTELLGKLVKVSVKPAPFPETPPAE